MLKILKDVHQCGVLHRDLKPHNICFKLKKESQIQSVHLIDYGLSKVFRESSNGGEHIEFKKSNFMVGSIRYCSLNSHRGYELSRRDDLESLGYNIIYLLKGTLPWQNNGIDEDSIELVRKST